MRMAVDVTPCDTDVTECHGCDIAPLIHKLILSHDLGPNFSPVPLVFRELCDILRHFVTFGTFPSTPIDSRSGQVAQGGRCDDAAHGEWSLTTCATRRRASGPRYFVRGLFRQPPASPVEWCNISAKCPKCCISLHFVARRCIGEARNNSDFGVPAERCILHTSKKRLSPAG